MYFKILFSEKEDLFIYLMPLNVIKRSFKQPKENTIFEVANIETNKIWWYKKNSKTSKRTAPGDDYASRNSNNKYTLMASGSDDKTIKIWDLPTGVCIVTLGGHRGSVTCLAQMNHMIVSGSTDATLKIWNIETTSLTNTAKSQCLRTLRGHEDFITCLNVFPCQISGAHLASSSIDKTIRLWSMTGRCVRVLNGHSSGVSCLVLTPCNSLIVSGSWDRTLKVWSLDTGVCLRTLRGHRNGVLSLVLLSNKEIASGSANTDRTIKIWDFARGECLRTLKGHWHAINCLSLMKHINCLVSSASSLNSWTKVWDLTRGECVRELRGPWYVRCMVLVPRTNVAVVSSGEKSVKVWDLKRDKCLCEFEGHESSVNALILINGFNDEKEEIRNNKKPKT